MNDLLLDALSRYYVLKNVEETALSGCWCFSSDGLLYQVVPTHFKVISIVYSIVLYRTWVVDMAKCPNCGEEVSEPDKLLENRMFRIEAYTCENCNCCFKVTR
jgi:hypothetical protein